jgi:hypothetical protein
VVSTQSTTRYGLRFFFFFFFFLGWQRHERQFYPTPREDGWQKEGEEAHRAGNVVSVKSQC